ncbi:hypothetical protein JI721_16455 [Alicyclobacillus cycloheptanicus]|nr:hypothetical protein JI721_16455 [Alicyclobacillus cycloheptanicus]
MDTAYRPGGWTVRQVVHHLAENQLVALSRLTISVQHRRRRVGTGLLLQGFRTTSIIGRI